MFQTAREGAAAAERPHYGLTGDQQAEDEHQAGGLHHAYAEAGHRRSPRPDLRLPGLAQPPITALGLGQTTLVTSLSRDDN